MSQLGLFDPREERDKREHALNLFEAHRTGLLEAARQAAHELCDANGRVTSPEVFAHLKARGYGEALTQVDPRFMGAVFREGAGWERIGWESKGSHRRPVSIWIRKKAA